MVPPNRGMKCFCLVLFGLKMRKKMSDCSNSCLLLLPHGLLRVEHVVVQLLRPRKGLTLDNNCSLGGYSRIPQKKFWSVHVHM